MPFVLQDLFKPDPELKAIADILNDSVTSIVSTVLTTLKERVTNSEAKFWIFEAQVLAWTASFPQPSIKLFEVSKMPIFK